MVGPTNLTTQMFSTPLNLLDSPEKLVEKATKELLENEQILSQTEAAQFKKYIKAKTDKILLELSTMASKGDSPTQMRDHAQKAIKELKASGEIFLSKYNSYSKTRQTVAQDLNNLDFKLKNTNLSFKKLSASTSQHADEHEAKHLEELAIGKTKSILTEKMGKFFGFGFELAAHTILAKNSTDSESPWRDGLISSGSHLTVLECIAQFFHHRTPIYAVATGSHIVADTARTLEKKIHQFSKNSQMKDLWNLDSKMTGEGFSYDLTMKQAEIFLKAAQIPSDLIKALHHKLSSKTAECCDSIGLTDEKIAQILKRIIEFSAKASPEAILMEESGLSMTPPNDNNNI